MQKRTRIRKKTTVKTGTLVSPSEYRAASNALNKSKSERKNVRVSLRQPLSRETIRKHGIRDRFIMLIKTGK